MDDILKMLNATLPPPPTQTTTKKKKKRGTKGKDLKLVLEKVSQQMSCLG